MKVRLSERARTYIREETRYLKARSTAAAKEFTAHIAKARLNLSAFTQMGFESDDLPVDGMRRLVVGDYLMDYEVTEQEIHVVSIRSGKRLSQSTILEPDSDYEDEAAPEYSPPGRR